MADPEAAGERVGLFGSQDISAAAQDAQKLIANLQSVLADVRTGKLGFKATIKSTDVGVEVTVFAATPPAQG